VEENSDIDSVKSEHFSDTDKDVLIKKYQEDKVFHKIDKNELKLKNTMINTTKVNLSKWNKEERSLDVDIQYKSSNCSKGKEMSKSEFIKKKKDTLTLKDAN